MKKIVKFWQDKNLTYRLLALVFALILFVNANNNSFQSIFYTQTDTYTENVSSVPVELIYDSDEYYVYGYETTINLTLSSVNRVQLDAEVNEDTRSFQVVADLSDLGTGTHEVNLRTQNLSSAVSATLETTTVTVTIEDRVTETMPVTPVLSSTALADGYTLDEATATPSSVEITTGAETLERIDRITALVSPTSPENADFSQDAIITALDSSGQTLSISANPDTVNVAVSVVAPTKEVQIETEQEGNLASGVESYTITLSTDTTTISGNQAVLNSIDVISIPVDVSDITSETVRTVNLSTDDYTADPETIRVTIRPNYSSVSSSNSNASQNNGGEAGNAGGNSNDSSSSGSSGSLSRSSSNIVTDESDEVEPETESS